MITKLRHSFYIGVGTHQFSGCEVLIADLLEGGSGEWGAEFEGVLWGGTESMLKGSILASGDLAIFVEVLNVENLLDGLFAGGSVGGGSKDWGDSGVGGG